MTPPKQCDLCDSYQNELPESGICRHCEAEIGEQVQKWVPVLEDYLVKLGRFEGEIRRRHLEGLSDGEALPAPRRPRDLPNWIIW